MVAEFNSKTHLYLYKGFIVFHPFHPRSLSKFLKSANMTLKLLKKLQKTHAKNVLNENVTEKWSFDFFYCVQKFSAYYFFGVNFLHFFHQILTQHQI
jgi:hypothetical protein